MNHLAVGSRDAGTSDRTWPRKRRQGSATLTRTAGWRWARGARSWAMIVAIIAVAIAAPLQAWPDWSASDPPAMAAAFTTRVDDRADLATHPIVGPWTLASSPAPPGVMAFHADGTVTNVTVWGGTGVGVWRPAGARSGEMIVQWPNRNPGSGEYRAGQTIMTGTFTVAEDGSTFTGSHQIELISSDGPPTLEQFNGTVEGTRIALDQDAAAIPAR